MKSTTCTLAVVALAIACCIPLQAQSSGSISGVLRGFDGSPQPGAPIEVRTANGQFVRSAQTDERGAYRFSELPPGNYSVAASSRSMISTERPSIDPATAVTVRAGTDVVGVDFRLPAPLGVRVSGRVIVPPGVAAPTGVWLRTASVPPQGFSANINRDGTFTFMNIPRGTYALRVVPLGPQLNAQTPTVIVGTQNIANLSLAVPTHFDLPVRFTVEGGDPLPPNLTRVQVAAASGSGTHYAESRPPGVAYLDIPLGEFKISLQGLPIDYSVQSITYGSTDLRTTALTVNAKPVDDIQVRLAMFPSPNRSTAKVGGQVTDLPALSYRYHPKIRLERVSPMGGGIHEIEVHDDGSFEFPRVPPGTYSLTTVGLASGVQSSVIVAAADIRNLVVPLAGVSNPFSGYVGSAYPVLFETSKATLKGVITQEIRHVRPRPASPLMYFRMEVIDEKTGKNQNWDVLIPPPGDGPQSPGEIPDIAKLKPGAQITILANASRDGTNRVMLVRSPEANTTIGIKVD